ncbi:hypothetical protein PVAG01_03105 [Phlyctema vagabunda]|uniref:Adhesin domain-containing protein n=1 Tax=Phlyctema vagabunda TaxID=108571 RepID=A0ABR4PSG8_9HELO
MPFSDNLYSAEDDSDNASFSDQLSPSDGYFNRSDIPPNVMVPDPSLEQSSGAEAKAREAREEAQSNAESQYTNTASPAISNSTPSQLYTSAPSNASPRSPPTSQTFSSPTSPRRLYNSMYTSQSPLMAGPPPAYSPPLPSSTPTSPQNTSPGTYNTFTPSRLEEGNHSEPQSMGAPPSQPTEETPLWTQRHYKTWARRALFQKVLYIALIASVIAAILAGIFGPGHSHNSKDPSPGTPKEPVMTPPTGPNDPEKVDPPPWKLPGKTGSPYCSYATHKAEESTFAWPMDTKLSIKQTTNNDYEGRNTKPVSVTGEIRIRPIPKNADHGPSAGYFTSYVYTSHPNLRVERSFDVDGRSLLIRTQRNQVVDTSGPHCISIEVTAWIPEGAQFESLSVDTVELTQRVFDGINLKTSNPSSFSSTSGGIHFPDVDLSAPGWKKSFLDKYNIDASSERDEFASEGAPILPDFDYDSRHIVIQTVSGSISGSYPLYDYLGVTSISGSVNIAVTPHKISEVAPLPAQLEIKTTSSSVKVHHPIHGASANVPPRNYITRVDTSSGSIHGDFIVGSQGTFQSQSGSVNLEVLPVLNSAKNSEFATSTISGSTHINLLDPIFLSVTNQERTPENVGSKPIENKDPYQELLPPNLPVDVKITDSKIRNLTSTHSSKSGTLNLQYPPAWEGYIYAKSLGSGSISLDGQDIEVITDHSRDWVHREVVARKPRGVEKASSVSIDSLSGSIHFKV